MASSVVIPRKNEAFLRDKDELPYIKPQQWVPVSFLMPDAMKNGGPCSWYSSSSQSKGYMYTDAFDEKPRPKHTGGNSVQNMCDCFYLNKIVLLWIMAVKNGIESK